VIIFIVIKKFPELIQIDADTLVETKEEKVKRRIIREKLERNFIIKVKGSVKKAQPWFKKIGIFAKRVFDKTLELERKYRKKLEPKTVAEREKIDNETEDLVKNGLELLAEEKFSEAERKFIDAVALDPKDIEAYQGLAELYWEQGKLDEAKQTYEYILKLNADNYDAYSHLGSIARTQGDLERARDCHLKSIELDSQAAVHYLDLAGVYQEREELDKAFECLEKAVGLEPNNPRNLDALLELSIMMGKKREAKEYLSRLIEVNPENQKIEEFNGRIKEMK
jgi:tetratricopeptide (TPR) repeat protein